MSATATYAAADLFPNRATRRALFLAALAVVALVATLPSTATAQTSQLSVGLTVEDRQITVGDPLALTIYAVYPDDYHVIFPTLPTEWGSFEVRSQTPEATVVGEDGSRTARQFVEVALFAPGDHRTPAFNISFRGPEGQILERPVSPVDVHVTSVLDPDDRALRDIRPQEDITVPSLWPWTLGAASLALLGLVLFAMRRRRTAAGLLVADWGEQRTPFQIAMDRLDQIGIDAQLRTPFEVAGSIARTEHNNNRRLGQFRLLANPPGQLESVRLGHLAVGQHDANRPGIAAGP